MKYTCRNYKIGRTTRHLTALIVALESKNNTIKTTHSSTLMLTFYSQDVFGAELTSDLSDQTTIPHKELIYAPEFYQSLLAQILYHIFMETFNSDARVRKTKQKWAIVKACNIVIVRTSGVYINGYRVIDMDIAGDGRVDTTGDVIIAPHDFFLPEPRYMFSPSSLV